MAATLRRKATASLAEALDAAVGVGRCVDHPCHCGDDDEPQPYCEQTDDEASNRTSPLPFLRHPSGLVMANASFEG